MPEFLPFAGIRYDCDAAGADIGMLAAPPYDVVDEEERVALEAADPRNSVRLILPRDEHAEGDCYARAASMFATWQRQGVLVADTTERFYAYRMEYRDAQGAPRHTRGVIGALRLPERGADDVLPHERTLPKAKSDRLALLRAMRVNVDPIWGLTLGAGLTDLLDGAAPLCSTTDDNDVHHELGAIDDRATIAEITRIVGSAALVLADGHHRFETACAYRDERRAAGMEDPGSDAIMCLVVELVDDELSIEPIHRLIDIAGDLASASGHGGLDIRAALADAFEIDDIGPATPENVDALTVRMRDEDGLGLVDHRGLAVAVARPDVRASALAAEHRIVAETDAALVEALVVPRLPDATWQYRHDAAAVVALVDKGASAAAILCSPVTVAQTRSAAIDRARMPQKTTFFAPKPRTGMVFRALD